MPSFFFGILLMYVLSLQLGWLPTGGLGDWKNLVMPVITLSTPSAAYIARYTRSSILDVRRQPYMRAADAKGVRFWRRVRWHLFPNAAIPVVTVLGQQFGWIIGGAVVVETIFAWPGIGRLLFLAVSRRDYETIQGLVLIIGVSVTITNFIVDLLYAWIDPRIRYGKANGS
jgi:peptide/nickel transport system permease protein